MSSSRRPLGVVGRSRWEESLGGFVESRWESLGVVGSLWELLGVVGSVETTDLCVWVVGAADDLSRGEGG